MNEAARPLTSRGKPPAPPADDDDPAHDWTPDETCDTEVMIGPDDLRELEAPEAVTPPQGVETLAGYELGRRDERLAWLADLPEIRALERHVGAANVLHAVRDHLVAEKADPAWTEAIIAALAARAGVKLG